MIYKLSLLLILTLSTSLYAFSKKPSPHIDDWDYNATIPDNAKHTRAMPSPLATTGMMMKKSIGLSAGGAKDADNFYENIKQGFLPKQSAITYEGVFYDHSFKTQAPATCETLFYPSYQYFQSKNPFSQEEESYLLVGLHSNIKEADFKRKKLNLVIVLDISGSMGAPFDSYYYDKGQKITLSKEEIVNSKMSIANQAIVSMIDHLEGYDKLAVVLFDSDAYLAKPLRSIETTDIQASKKHILDIKPRGGTNWSEGYQKGIALFENREEDKNLYENRIIFLTDAMPNRGELEKEGLFSIAKEASQKGIYTTFIGVGVDFNNDLVEAVSKTKGANYYAIHSASDFQKRLDEEFDYMVTPLVFDLELSLKSPTMKIDAVYGSPEANLSTGQLMMVNTLFASPTGEEGTRGGVILLKLKDPSNDALLEITYHDREGVLSKASQKIQLTQTKSTQTIQKTILLSRYVDLMKNFSLDMHQSCHDNVTVPYTRLLKHISISPQHRDTYPKSSQWERKSCPLKVSAGYQKILTHFTHYFKEQMRYIDDESLDKELHLLSTLQTQAKPNDKIDDWKDKK